MANLLIPVFGLAVGEVIEPVLLNFDTQMPFCSVLPKVNDGWVNKLPSLFPFCLVSVEFSKFMHICFMVVWFSENSS